MLATKARQSYKYGEKTNMVIVMHRCSDKLVQGILFEMFISP